MNSNWGDRGWDGRCEGLGGGDRGGLLRRGGDRRFLRRKGHGVLGFRGVGTVDLGSSNGSKLGLGLNGGNRVLGNGGFGNISGWGFIHRGSNRNGFRDNERRSRLAGGFIHRFSHWYWLDRNLFRLGYNGNRLSGFSDLTGIIALNSLFFEETEDVVEDEVTIWLLSQEESLNKFTPCFAVI